MLIKKEDLFIGFEYFFMNEKSSSYRIYDIKDEIVCIQNTITGVKNTLDNSITIKEFLNGTRFPTPKTIRKIRLNRLFKDGI